MPAALPIAQEPAALGAHVFTIGFPHPDVLGTQAKLTDGLISASTGIGNDPRLFQISVPVQAGNSGGPLLNSNGEVVGIVSAKLNSLALLSATGDLPQNVNYAIKSAYLQSLLKTTPSVSDVPVLRVTGGTVESMAELVKQSVMMVLVQR